jgi:hypothetical protein
MLIPVTTASKLLNVVKYLFIVPISIISHCFSKWNEVGASSFVNRITYIVSTVTLSTQCLFSYQHVYHVGAFCFIEESELRYLAIGHCQYFMQ